jgi:hypothetical protein
MRISTRYIFANSNILEIRNLRRRVWCRSAFRVTFHKLYFALSSGLLYQNRVGIGLFSGLKFHCHSQAWRNDEKRVDKNQNANILYMEYRRKDLLDINGIPRKFLAAFRYFEVEFWLASTMLEDIFTLKYGCWQLKV